MTEELALTEVDIKKSKVMICGQMQPTNLPIMAQRVFLVLLSKIDQTEDGDTFIIQGKDIASLSHLAPNVVGQQLQKISEASDTLRQYTLVIHEEDGNDLRVGLISSSKYLKGERALRVSVDRYLLPHIRKWIQNYDISYQIKGPMQFKSEYSLPLYDMMNLYLPEGQHYFTVEETRKMFNIPDGRVKNTATLNQKVINKAINDINNYTDLEVSVEPQAQGRKIYGYIFQIKDKRKKQKEKMDFIKLVVNSPYNFNENTLKSYISKYGFESVKRNFEYTKSKNPKDFAKYLNKAISGQFAEEETSTTLLAKTPSQQSEQAIPKDYILQDNKENIDHKTYKMKCPQVAKKRQEWKEKRGWG